MKGESFMHSRRFGLCACILVLSSSVQVQASPPSEPEERAKLIGQPTRLDAAPANVTLTGGRATQQMVVTGRYADGSVRDLTPFVNWKLAEAGVVEITDGFLSAKKAGSTQLVAEAGKQKITIPITVLGFDKPDQVSFRHQVVAALNVGGCNAGACHGTPSGKNGFRLSLRGYDPAQDYLQLTRDVLGRRTDRLNPFASLLLQKGLGRVPHEGGARFGADGVAVQMMSGWLAEGMRDDPTNLPSLKKIEVLPGSRVLNAPARWQQLAVLAHFSDGSVRDVTRLTVFSSSEPGVADVTPNGLVEFKQAGEVAILCRYLEEMQALRLTYLEPRDGFVWNKPPEANFIDKFVFAKLKQMSIPPSGLCTDEEFVRRAYLDACGLLPTPDEAKKFLDDKSANKRAKLIDALLDRPEFSDFWALKWADVFRSSRKTIQLKGAHAFQQWLRDRFIANAPFDSIVHDIITSNGNTYSSPPANYYRIAKDPQNLAETTAQLFFGVRMQCAKCHNHPFERWTQDDYYSMAAWFARIKVKADTTMPGATKQAPLAEIVFSARDGEITQPRSGKVMAPKFLGGKIPAIAPGTDRRDVFADWLTDAANPFFAKSVANRVWFHLNGKGIVDPVDDFRESNPSCNDELLEALAKDFAGNKYDMRKLIRTIMNSRTYQLSAQPNDINKDDGKYFSHAITKQLTAEQLLDALCDVTGLPEKFTGLPLGTRAIQLPDGEVNHPFLKAFGQPARELVCECERESDSNLGQALQLINGPTINEKIRNPGNRLGKLMTAKKADRDILDELYLVTLSRLPTDAERTPALSHVGRNSDKRRAWEDVLWALLNTREFLFRH
jgi:hypothetical protein